MQGCVDESFEAVDDGDNEDVEQLDEGLVANLAEY